MHPDYYRWQYYKSHAHAIKQNTRLVFKVLDFQTQSKSLQDAILFLKTHFSSNKPFSDYKFDEIPIEFIPSKMKRYIITKNKEAKNIKTVDFDCYEFMLYMHIAKGIRKGDVTIKDSLTYKSLDDELIPKSQ